MNRDIVDHMAAARWTGSQTITFGFPTDAGFALGLPEYGEWAEAQAGYRDMAREAALLWDDLMAAEIVETDDAGADIKFSESSGAQWGYAYFPGEVGDESDAWQKLAGSVWIDPRYTNVNARAGADPDGWALSTVIHEMGHALGLEHAGEYNGTVPVYMDPSTGSLWAEDTLQFTIMSYLEASNSGANHQASVNGVMMTMQPQTPMVYDVLAIQQLYGVDTETRTGDTTYGFNADVNRDVFDFEKNDHPVLTIWDAGGTDTLDLSGYGTRATVDLAPGAYSSVNGMTHNIGIAFEAWIENAAGGRADDLISGNTRDNVLHGHDGNDTLLGLDGLDTLWGGAGEDRLEGGAGTDFLLGGEGDDELIGGEGADILFHGAGADSFVGGEGLDYVTFAVATEAVSLDLFAGVAGGAGEGDTFEAIEAYFLSAHADTLEGSVANEFIFAQDGDDVIRGGGGGDILYGEGGDDFIESGALSDLVSGGEGADTFHYALNDLQQDQILDFTSGEDVISLDAAGFGLVGTPLVEGENLFFTDTATGVLYGSNATAVIYYADLGLLYVDTDGAGGVAANLLAALAGAPVLSLDDFVLA